MKVIGYLTPWPLAHGERASGTNRIEGYVDRRPLRIYLPTILNLFNILECESGV